MIESKVYLLPVKVIYNRCAEILFDIQNFLPVYVKFIGNIYSAVR